MVNTDRELTPEELEELLELHHWRVELERQGVFDVGVRDSVWSPDLGRYVDVFYVGEAQEVYPDWDWRK